MSFSGATYIPVAGAITALPGQTVQSAVWNNINNDYATALTMVMSELISINTFRNILWMNGGFEVWQRGAGSSASIAVSASNTPGTYTADRWYLLTNANQACTVSAQTGLSNLSRLCARVQRNAGETGVGTLTFGHPLDLDEIFRMRGKKISLSFLVQAGATFSPTSGTLTVAFYTGTGSIAKRGGGFTGETTVLSISTNLTAGGAAVAVAGSSSVVVPLTTTQAELQFTWTPAAGAAGATDYFNVDDLQVEPQNSASTWTPTLFDSLPFHNMLQGCKRYYQKTFPYDTAPATGVNSISNALGANAIATQRLFVDWLLPVELRATGTVTTFIPYTGTTASWYDFTASTSVAVSVDANANGTKGVVIYSTTSGSTTNNRCYVHAQTDAGI